MSKWDAEELDKAIAEVHATGGIVFTPEEWLEHPHGKNLAARPVVQITRINDTKPEPLPAEGGEPLSGIRVLELTRILAGPTAGISMAEHGADVLMVTSPRRRSRTLTDKARIILDRPDSPEKVKIKDCINE